jgi:sigma-B regulation protein RsbU (phosphoserine phosphatase)
MDSQINAITKLLENFTISAWLIDSDQNIVFINPHMQELFGDLSGKKTSFIYDSSSFEIVNEAESEAGGSAEIIIADVPFRRLSSSVDLEDHGHFRIELFEDISEEKHISNNMTNALAKINSETKMARTIQNSILPIDDTYWNTIAFSSLYMPADDVGGDFYDLLKLNDDEFLIYVADVAGHGIQASLLTIFMRERVRTNEKAALAGTGDLLEKLVEDFCALDIDFSLYVTMAICKYTKSKKELSISNAGHNCYPLIVRNNGKTETIPTKGMPICAIADGVFFDEELVNMNPGDRLILYTDGIVEEVDSATGKVFGPEGVRELAEKYHEYNGSYLARKIMDESARFVLLNAKDDRTILISDILS